MILAANTSGNITDLWLFSAAGETIAEQTWDSGRALADELLGRLEQFLQAHDTAFSDLTGLIIFSGPGSFTSLRIGHTVFNALADSLDIPVVGASGHDFLVAGRQQLADAQIGVPALPHYGAEANVTLPKP